MANTTSACVVALVARMATAVHMGVGYGIHVYLRGLPKGSNYLWVSSLSGLMGGFPPTITSIKPT